MGENRVSKGKKYVNSKRKKEIKMASIYDYQIEKTDGTVLDLKDLKGQVLLIVNTATGCGFTPHYEPLTDMYNKYHDQGFEIIDIPCNQFAGQTPGTDEEIKEFCSLNYGTPFEHMKKSDVNGDTALPIYAYLKEQKGFEGFKGEKADFMDGYLRKDNPDYDKTPDIKWNFTKFLIDRDGTVAARFEPTDDMDQVEKAVVSLL